MGVYINHPDMPKEQWLAENAIVCYPEDAKKHEDYEDVLLVVLLNNVLFTAALVVHSPQEKAAVINDRRVRRYYLVERSKLPEDARQHLDIFQGRK